MAGTPEGRPHVSGKRTSRGLKARRFVFYMYGLKPVPFRERKDVLQGLLNAAKVMPSSQVELSNAARSRTEKEICAAGAKERV